MRQVRCLCGRSIRATTDVAHKLPAFRKQLDTTTNKRHNLRDEHGRFRPDKSKNRVLHSKKRRGIAVTVGKRSYRISRPTNRDGKRDTDKKRNYHNCRDAAGKFTKSSMAVPPARNVAPEGIRVHSREIGDSQAFIGSTALIHTPGGSSVHSNPKENPTYLIDRYEDSSPSIRSIAIAPDLPETELPQPLRNLHGLVQELFAIARAYDQV